MDLKEVGYKSDEQIEVAHDGVQVQVFVNAVMNIWVV